jgi:prepilin-type N-terminal cleavage/methylation domain-containing protein
MRTREKKSRGFTLLEMLVVLVITALISALLFQGLAYMTALRARFLGQLESLQAGVLQEYWFRSASAGLVAEYPDIEQAHLFKGETRRFEGLSLAGLDTPQGVPAPFAWELAEQGRDTLLRYVTASGEAWIVAQWPGSAEGFAYLDDAGEWHRQWPPSSGLEPPQLPVALSLSARRRDGAFAWVVKLADRREPRVDYRLID